MLVNRNGYGFSSQKKLVTGTGFVDSLANIFNSIEASAAPVFKSFGNYVSDNKDLIAKPVLGAIGSLAATGLASGIPAIISHIAKRNRIKNNADQGFNGNKSTGPQKDLSENLEPKYKEILQNIVKSKNSTNNNSSSSSNSNNNSSSSSNNMQNPLTNIIGSGIKSFLMC